MRKRIRLANIDTNVKSFDKEGPVPTPSKAAEQPVLETKKVCSSGRRHRDTEEEKKEQAR